jgi:predicted MFS family arabinose efflux permease
MDKDIHKIMELVGNKHRYVIFVIIMNLIIWINVSVVNYSLAFIETKPEVSYTDGSETKNTKLNYEICEKFNYTVTKDYKYSIITDFKDGTECNKLKNSLIGTFHSLGVLLGNFLFQVIPAKIGYKNLLVYFHYIHAVLVLITIFYKNYYYFQVLNCVIMFVTKIMLNTSLVISNEIIDFKYKSLISSFINSGNGLGGMFYVLMYFLIEDWRYVFVVSVCITAISGIIIHIFYHESMAYLLINKDYERFYNTLLYISKKNNRIKEFEEEINKNEEFKQCLEQLKSYTLPDKNEKESENKKEDIKVIEVESQNSLKKQKKLNLQKSGQSDELSQIKDNTTNRNAENKTELKELKEIKETNNEVKLSNEKTTKKIKGSFFQLFKYPSVRYIAIILSVGWFCNSTLFYGLVIGIKTLKGSQYRNTAILYVCDFCAYNVSGFFSNSKLGRKISLQIFTMGYGIFCLIMCFTFDYNKNVVVGFYFCARLSMICAFCVYYTYAFESYPISVANIGYSLNSATCSLAGIIIPFIIEYLKEKYVFLIYGIFGVVCTGLFFFLKETRGMPRADNIKEIEEELNNEQK